MKSPVIFVGIGEMGGVFARGILRLGHPVIPVTRDMDMQEIADAYPDPQLVLVSVAENDLHHALEKLPAQWHDRLGLLQNELLPRDWEIHSFTNPTVISVWFEKKKGQDFKVLIPSPAFGPQAQLLVDALAALTIPARIVADEKALLDELVIKNVYILTTNISGLITEGDVNDLWQNHRELATEIANEVIDLQTWLTNSTFDRSQLIKGFVEGINGDLEHMCMGRSAPARLTRAISLADEAGLAVPRMREIYAHKVQ
jgi:ketopantoate reductase